MTQLNGRPAGIGLLILLFVVTACGGGSDDGSISEELPIQRFFDERGNPVAPDDRIDVGSSTLRRSADGLQVRAGVEGLNPGGVYSLWLVVIQGEPEDLGRVFNTGTGIVVGDTGEFDLSLSADVGDPGIVGWSLDGIGPVTFGTLDDPMTAPLRLEVAYHGQASDAGDDLDAWLTDFWSGTPGICPSPVGSINTGAIPSQPYCPAFWAVEYDAVN